MQEIFKPVPGFEYLSASNLGRIKRQAHTILMRRFWRDRWQEFETKLPELIMKQELKKGYMKTFPFGKSCFVHRLVASAFIPNPDNKPFINHKNGVKNDNRVENLEWCTSQENTQHALKNGLYPDRKKIEVNYAKGERSGNSKLTEKQVLEIRQKYKPGRSKTARNGYSSLKLAEEYGVSKPLILSIIHRRSWKHI